MIPNSENTSIAIPNSFKAVDNSVTQDNTACPKFETLKKVELFKGFPEKTLKFLAEHCKVIKLTEEEVLCSEGEPGKKMWVVQSGKLLIYKSKKTIDFLGAGDFVGEMSLIDHKPRAASVRGIGNSVLLEINDEVFNKYIISEPKAVRYLITMIVSRARHNLDIIVTENMRLSCLVHDMRNYLVPLSITENHLLKLFSMLEGTDKGHVPRKGVVELGVGLKKMVAVRDNLITLIDQTLAMGVKTKGDYVRIPSQIIDLVNETAEEIAYHKYLKNKKIRVNIIKANMPEAIFNVLDVKRVLQNLIINAGYASEKNSEIEVRVEEVNDNVQVSVMDSGSGIPNDVKPLILKEKFSTKPDGNGFGLLSCREIIENYHEGKLAYESEWGVGTTFYFQIPFKPMCQQNPSQRTKA